MRDGPHAAHQMSISNLWPLTFDLVAFSRQYHHIPTIQQVVLVQPLADVLVIQLRPHQQQQTAAPAAQWQLMMRQQAPSWGPPLLPLF